MQRPALLLILALLALPATALVQAQTSPERLTPRPPPTAAAAKLTPDHAEPKERAPSAAAVLQPPPVVPVPLSPVVVPGEPPAATEALPAVPVAAQPPAKATPAKPADKKPAVRTLYAKEGIYIRATPSRTGRVLDTLEAGEAAQVLSDKAPEPGWVRIARSGRPAGWVASSYLSERRTRRP